MDDAASFARLIEALRPWLGHLVIVGYGFDGILDGRTRLVRGAKTNRALTARALADAAALIPLPESRRHPSPHFAADEPRPADDTAAGAARVLS